MSRKLAALLVAALTASTAAAAPKPAKPAKGKPAKLPETPKKPVTDEFFGVKVSEDYRWLENADDPAVKAWSDAENAVTRAALDKLASADLRKRITELDSGKSPDYGSFVYRPQKGRPGMLFAMKEEPPKQQPFLVGVTLAGAPGSEYPILDPNTMDAKGATEIDWYVPSLDGKRVAVSLSQGGSEDGSVHIYDSANGKPLPDVIPGVNFGTAGGSLAWNAAGTGFWYTRYPRGSEHKPEDMHFYQQVWFHTLGTATDKDSYVIGKDFPRIAEIELGTSEDGAYVLAQVANGDGGEFAYYLASSKTNQWTQVAKFADHVVAAALGPAGDPSLYLFSRAGAPKGKILTVPLAKPALAAAKVLVPEAPEGAIQSFVPGKTRLYVSYLMGGPTELWSFDKLKGSGRAKIETLPVSSVGGLTRLDGDSLLYRNESYIDSPAWFTLDSGKPVKTAFAVTPVADYADTEVVRVMATSKDGTQVPINIIKQKSLELNKANPTILSGYGGYGVSRSPRYTDLRKLWIEHGGVYALANLRGGGEYGDAWHLAGNLTKKQNVFDDFYACAQLLVAQGFTSQEHLAIIGGSNGGLLMGAAFTQHPEAYRAVVSYVGIYDMLRVELSPNGAFNTTEFGSVKDEAQFKALYAYSPYHHVKDGGEYPSILFLTGANDPRVDPMNSRKMTARLQAANKSKHPILLRTSQTSGHGIGTALNEQIDEDVDVYSFLFHELGIKLAPPAKAKPAKAAKP